MVSRRLRLRRPFPPPANARENTLCALWTSTRRRRRTQRVRRTGTPPSSRVRARSARSRTNTASARRQPRAGRARTAPHRQRKALVFAFRFRRFRRSGSAPNAAPASLGRRAERAHRRRRVPLRAREHVRVVPQRAPRVRGAAQRHENEEEKTRRHGRRRAPRSSASSSTTSSAATTQARRATKRLPVPGASHAAAHLAEASTDARRAWVAHASQSTRSRAETRECDHAAHENGANATPRPSSPAGPTATFVPRLRRPTENVTKTPGGTRMEPLMEPCDAPSRVFARGMLAYNTCVLRTRATSSRVSAISAGTASSEDVPFRGTRGVGAPFTRSSARDSFANTALPPSRHRRRVVRGEFVRARVLDRGHPRSPRASRSPRARGPADGRQQRAQAGRLRAPLPAPSTARARRADDARAPPRAS